MDIVSSHYTDAARQFMGTMVRTRMPGGGVFQAPSSAREARQRRFCSKAKTHQDLPYFFNYSF
jgi:hypothetical protein